MIGPVTYDLNEMALGKRGREEGEGDLSGRSVKLLREDDDPVITLSRRNAFVGGVMAYRDFMRKTLNQLDDEVLEELGLSPEDLQPQEEIIGIKLSKSQYSEIDDVAKNKSPRLASQFFELYQILAAKRTLKRESGTNILNLARRLIAKLEDKDVQSMDIDEINPEFQEMADKYTKMMSLDLPEEFAKEACL